MIEMQYTTRQNKVPFKDTHNSRTRGKKLFKFPVRRILSCFFRKTQQKDYFFNVAHWFSPLRTGVLFLYAGKKGSPLFIPITGLLSKTGIYYKVGQPLRVAWLCVYIIKWSLSVTQRQKRVVDQGRLQRLRPPRPARRQPQPQPWPPSQAQWLENLNLLLY